MESWFKLKQIRRYKKTMFSPVKPLTLRPTPQVCLAKHGHEPQHYRRLKRGRKPEHFLLRKRCHYVQLQADDFTKKLEVLSTKCVELTNRWFHGKKWIFDPKKLVKMRGVAKKMVSRKKLEFLSTKHGSICVELTRRSFHGKKWIFDPKKLVKKMVSRIKLEFFCPRNWSQCMEIISRK